MILQPTTVQLTKIRFLDEKNKNFIPSISRQVFDKASSNGNIIKKNNIFGHRWVLKINEISTENEKNGKKLFIYILLFSGIIIALTAGLHFLFDIRRNFSGMPPKIIATTSHIIEPVVVTNFSYMTVSTARHKLAAFCQNCTDDSVCLKLTELDQPTCVQSLDRKDPTGCGGHCTINTQYCHELDKQHKVYQCRKNKNILECPADSFNCGNMCISIRKRCDGIIHCSDKSDETNCNCNLSTHFHCGNDTSCILKEKRCDGSIDCWDKSDEDFCNKTCDMGFISCRNGECIEKETFCDGKVDCADHSDEPEGCQI